MGLFSPGWKSKKLDKALACVDHISDNDKLEKIIQEASEPMVCRKAAERLTDPERIHRLVIDCPNSWVRYALVSKVSDAALLRRIAEKDESVSVREVALKSICDPSFLSDYAMRAEDQKLVMTAIRQLEDEDALCKLAATTGSVAIAKACMLRLSVGEHPEAGILLDAIADGGMTKDFFKSFNINGGAIEQKCLAGLGGRLSSQSLKRLADGKTVTARRCALPYLASDELTRRIRQEPDADLRAELIRSLPVARTLLDIAASDPSPKCRVAALEGLRDGKLCGAKHKDALYAIASQDGNGGCRDIAYRLLKDMRKKLDNEWWAAHIDDEAPDQRLARLVRAGATDRSAALKAARLIVEGKNDDYLRARIGMSVVEVLEQMVSDGDAKAAKALHALYISSDLNPALKVHAEAQKPRFTSTHRDGMVDSSVCGETFTHGDWYSNWSIRPL